MPGITLTLLGAAATIGTFGMLAFIGMPILMVGLGLISSQLPE